MAFNKTFVISVFSIYFSFCCCSISIKWISSCILCVFTFGICNFCHVGFHVRILIMRITVEVVPPPEISQCRAFTWIIVVPVNQVTLVVQARYLDPLSYPGFMWMDKLSKQRNTCTPGYLGGPRYPCPPRDISPHVNKYICLHNEHITWISEISIVSDYQILNAIWVNYIVSERFLYIRKYKKLKFSIWFGMGAQ